MSSFFTEMIVSTILLEIQDINICIIVDILFHALEDDSKSLITVSKFFNLKIETFLFCVLEF